MKITPAWRNRSTMMLSAGGTKSFKMGDPDVMGMPLTGTKSFTA